MKSWLSSFIILTVFVVARPGEAKDRSLERKADRCRKEFIKKNPKLKKLKSIQALRELKKSCGFVSLGSERFSFYFRTCKEYLVYLYQQKGTERSHLRKQVQRCRQLAENYQNMPVLLKNKKFESCQVSSCRRDGRQLLCQKRGEVTDNVGVLFCRTVFAPLYCMQRTQEKLETVRWQAGKSYGQLSCQRF